jgi:hypothetical protein
LRLLLHAKGFEGTAVDVPNFKRRVNGEQCEENQIHHEASVAELRRGRQQLSDERPDYRMDSEQRG